MLDIEDYLILWKEYIKTVFNDERGEIHVNTKNETGPSILKEVPAAIQSAKDGKATGLDELHAEVGITIIFCQYQTFSVLLHFVNFRNVWKNALPTNPYQNLKGIQIGNPKRPRYLLSKRLTQQFLPAVLFLYFLFLSYKILFPKKNPVSKHQK